MDTSSRQHDLNRRSPRDPEPPVTSWLHPHVYALLIGFAGWFALAVWSFAGSGVTDYLLVIVSGFIFVEWRCSSSCRASGTRTRWRKSAGRHCATWVTWDFDTWQDRLSGAQAALQILLPIAVAALGMTAFGIAFHIAEHGGT